MKVSARSYLTYGIATLGATALVAAPITPITPTAPDVVRPVQRAVGNAALVQDLDLDALNLEAVLDLDSLDLDGLLELLPGMSAGGIGDSLGGIVEDFIDALGIAIGGGIVFITVPGVPVPVPVIDPGLLTSLSMLPTALVGFIEGVIANPASLPNALSGLIYGLVYPLPLPVGPGGALVTVSLLSVVLLPIATALQDNLPPALAGPFAEIFGAVGQVVVDLLGLLPNPGPPFGPSLAAATTSGGTLGGLLDGLFDGDADGGGLLGGLFDWGDDDEEVTRAAEGGGGLFGLFDRDDVDDEEAAEKTLLSVEQTADEEEEEKEVVAEDEQQDEPQRQVTRRSLDFGFFSGNRSGSRSAANTVAVNGQTVAGTDTETTPRHRLGGGDDNDRFSVRNIVNRITGGLDRDDDDNDGGAKADNATDN
jgi:hypothetical protein